MLEGGHDVMGEVNVLEHALQLVCELAPAFCFELCDHGLLCIAAGAAPQQQPLCQIFLVECLEDILALRL